MTARGALPDYHSGVFWVSCDEWDVIVLMEEGL